MLIFCCFEYSLYDFRVIKKYEPSDIFTGETKDLYEFHGKLVSRKSIVELAKLAGIISQDEDV